MKSGKSFKWGPPRWSCPRYVAGIHLFGPLAGNARWIPAKNCGDDRRRFFRASVGHLHNSTWHCLKEEIQVFTLYKGWLPEKPIATPTLSLHSGISVLAQINKRFSSPFLLQVDGFVSHWPRWNSICTTPLAHVPEPLIHNRTTVQACLYSQENSWILNTHLSY